jgi:hypothetical protein
MKLTIILIAVFGVAAIFIFIGCSKRQAPSTSTSSGYTPPTLDPQNVPTQFRDLVPLATKWGIGDDEYRSDMHAKASEQDKQELQQALKGRARAINDWLDTFGKGKMTPEAAAFMYMMLGVDEMGMKLE